MSRRGIVIVISRSRGISLQESMYEGYARCENCQTSGFGAIFVFYDFEYFDVVNLNSTQVQFLWLQSTFSFYAILFSDDFVGDPLVHLIKSRLSTVNIQGFLARAFEEMRLLAAFYLQVYFNYWVDYIIMISLLMDIIIWVKCINNP